MKIQEIRALKIGDFVRIQGEKLQVIKIRADAIPDLSQDPPLRQYHAIFLGSFEGKETTPKLELCVFDDNNEILVNEAKKISEEEIVKSMK
jgi:hypothetical protein